MIILYFKKLLIDVANKYLKKNYSFHENEEEEPEGWFLSFDDHPTLTNVIVNAYGNGNNELCPLKIKQLKKYVFINTEYDFASVDWNLFTTNNPNIKSLTIEGYELNTEDLKYIVTNLVELEEFTLNDSGHTDFQYADLRLILESCRNIKIIDVTINEKQEYHSEFLEEFAEKLKTIKLNIQFMDDFCNFGKFIQILKEK